MSKLVYYFIFTVSLTCLFSACSKNEGDDEKDSGSNHVSDLVVVVNEDGTTSNGSVFSSINDKNFYIDYIKYTVREGHLEVSGYDNTGFKGIAKIVSKVTYKGNTYEVLSLGEKAFAKCEQLTSIAIPNSVINIQNYVFVDCINLSSVYMGNNIKNINSGVFKNCQKLTSIDIPDNVNNIGPEAFYGCTSITSIVIPSNVIYIGTDALWGCSNLSSIIVNEGNTVYDSRENCNAIIRTADNTVIMGCKNSFIPQSVESIFSRAFGGNDFLTSIDIPDKVNTIWPEAFYYCRGLTTVKIGNSIESIGYSAFAHCESLTSIILPESLSSIDREAFYYCSSLKSITLPNSAISIETGAFIGCTNLESIHCKNSKPKEYSMLVNCFDRASFEKAILYVPIGSMDVYKNTFPWENFKTIVEE